MYIFFFNNRYDLWLTLKPEFSPSKNKTKLNKTKRNKTKQNGTKEIKQKQIKVCKTILYDGPTNFLCAEFTFVIMKCWETYYLIIFSKSNVYIQGTPVAAKNTLHTHKWDLIRGFVTKAHLLGNAYFFV